MKIIEADPNSDSRLLPAHFEVLIADRADELSSVLKDFVHVVNAVVLQIQNLCDLLDEKCDVFISMDLCELVDSAMSFEGVYEETATSHPSARRRILTDVAFSLEAVDRIVDGQFRFTILPATAAEIVYFISTEYGKHKAVSQLLKLPPNFLSRSATDNLPRFLGASKYKSFSELIELSASSFGMTDRLVRHVHDLLNNRYFISPEELYENLDLSVLDYKSYLHAFDLVRPEKKGTLSNIADALNLETVRSINDKLLTPSSSDRCLSHMTRTHAMHRPLAEIGPSHNLAITFKAGRIEFPMVLSPKVPCLLGYLVSGSQRPESLFQEGLNLKEQWDRLSSSILRLCYSVKKRESARQIGSYISQIEEKFEENLYGRAIADFFRLYVESATFSDQYFEAGVPRNLPEAKFQADFIRESLEHTEALSRLEEFIRLQGILSERTGLNNVVFAIETFDFRIKSKRRALLAELEGLHLREIPADENHPWADYRLVTKTKHSRLVVGAQVHEADGNTGVTIFWPRPPRIQHFLKAVGKVVPNHEGNGHYPAVYQTHQGHLGRAELAASDLSNPGRFLRASPSLPIDVLQIVVGDMIITWEKTASGRIPCCSVRCKGKVPAAVADLYIGTSIVLKEAIILDFIKYCTRKKKGI